jgi:hypothetical protein
MKTCEIVIATLIANLLNIYIVFNRKFTGITKAPMDSLYHINRYIYRNRCYFIIYYMTNIKRCDGINQLRFAGAPFFYIYSTYHLTKPALCLTSLLLKTATGRFRRRPNL